MAPVGSGISGSGGGSSGIGISSGSIGSGGSSNGSGVGRGGVVPVAATTALVVEAAVLLLSLLTLHLTLILIQTMNSLMHYLIPIVLNVN